MNIDLVEIELASFLAGRLNALNIDVVPLPQTQAEFEKPFERNKVTVMFVSEKADPNQALGTIGQHVTIQWGFQIQSTKLRGNDGIHFVAELVKKCMTGYRPTDADRLYYVGHDFVNYSDNEWEHRVLFECKGMRVDSQDYIPGPLLKDVDFIEK